MNSNDAASKELQKAKQLCPYCNGDHLILVDTFPATYECITCGAAFAGTFN